MPSITHQTLLLWAIRKMTADGYTLLGKAGTAVLRERDAAALFDEQGLGKSRQLIDAIIQEQRAGNLDGALIVCPNTIKPTWGEEIERFANVPYAIFGSGRAARRVAFRSL